MTKSGKSKATYRSFVKTNSLRSVHRSFCLAAILVFCLSAFAGCTIQEPTQPPVISFAPLQTSSVTRLTLKSSVFDATVPFLVYLPVGYTPSQKYPVWYAMHGYSSTEKWWLDDANIGDHADALAASGELAPMIMVFPMTRYDDAKTIEADMADGIRGPSRMERFLCEELIPYIDGHYSTICSAEGRFIGGFSMGGLFALQIGLHQPQLFSKIGAYSPALTYSDFFGDHFERWLSADFADAANLNGYAKAHGLDGLSIYLDCGDENDPFSAGAASLQGALTARGINSEFHPHGGGHSLDLTLLDPYLLFYAGT